MLNDRESVIKQLRRLKQLRKDAQGREYYETTYDGKPLRFYNGYAMELPSDWVKALVGYGGSGGYGDGVVIPIQEACGNCCDKAGNPTGFKTGNVCGHCKGKKWLDTGEMYHVFKMVPGTEVDPMNFDKGDLPMRKLNESASVKEAEESLT